MMDFSMLTSPIKIGTMEIKNRMVQAPMFSAADLNGSLTERVIAYHKARARGGFAWISPGVVSVHPLGVLAPAAAGLWDDRHIASWRNLSNAVHEYGARLVPQLNHAGNKANPKVIGTQPLGPSPLSYPVTQGMPLSQSNAPVAKEMNLEEIEEVVESFGQAARRAREAGCDGVILHCAHGFLLSQFISPAENKRTDAYGGGTAGRLKIVMDIIQRVRARAGDLVIIVRMNGNDMSPGGLHFEEAQLIAWLLSRAGIDCLDVSRGSVSYSLHEVEPASGAPPATWTSHYTRLVKQMIDIPVIATGKIYDPLMAEFILRTGQADLISFGRASLADPDLPNKVTAGKIDDIRRCIHCVTCIGVELAPIGCAINPETGWELETSPLVKAEKPQKILVVGGGPGGLEAARVTALRGHQVTLCEKSDRLGGQLWVGALPPGKQEFTEIIKWLDDQVRRAGVKVQLRQEVTPALVSELKPDVVIVATGAEPFIPSDIPGTQMPNVCTAHDVLTEKAHCGGRVVVLGASMVACEVADWLSLHGKLVTMIKMRPGIEIAEDVASPIIRAHLKQRLEPWKIRFVNGWAQGIQVKQITNEGVVILRDGQEEMIEADSVVLALGVRSVNSLAEQLRGMVPAVHVIGDAKEPRKIWNAMREGAAVGRTI